MLGLYFIGLGILNTALIIIGWNNSKFIQEVTKNLSPQVLLLFIGILILCIGILYLRFKPKEERKVLQ